jgi:hypothetical protein
MFAKTRIELSFLNVISPTVEAVILNAISGILAQAFTAYKSHVIQYHNDKFLEID